MAEGTPARPWWAAARLIHLLVPFAAGMIVLIAMQFPAVDYSMLGQPDREMIESAFNLRVDVPMPGTTADPALLIDIDDASMVRPTQQTGFPAPPDGSAPRGLIASALTYILRAPPNQGPSAVLLDVDIANTTDDNGAVASLRKVLQTWATTPGAPALIISREAFPAQALGLKGQAWTLPASPYDDIVEASQGRIQWGSTRVLSDRFGMVREFPPLECVNTRLGERALLASPLLAYLASVHGRAPENAPVQRWLHMGCGPTDQAQVDSMHGALINYHLSLTLNEEPPVWGDVPPSWPGYHSCNQTTGAPLVQIVSAAALAGVVGDADTSMLCHRLVAIGGTNGVAQDFRHTPVHYMAGVMILINAARGLELSNGGLKRVPLAVQIAVILVVSLAIWAGFHFTGRIRKHYRRLRTRHREQHWITQLRFLPLNPIILHWAFSFAAHWIGVGLLLWALDKGYWGYLSAPAFAAAAAGAIQEVSDEED